MKNPFKRKKKVIDTPIVYPFSIQDRTGIRRSGQSTRLVDKYIQELFEGKEVAIIDHYWGNSVVKGADSNRKASEYLAKSIARRLSIEHQINLASNHIKLDTKIKQGRIYMKLIEPEKVLK